MADLSTADRLAIAEVIARYCHSIDRGRWEDFATLFTPDCRLDLSQVMGLYEGPEGIKKFTDTMAGIPVVMRHLTTNIVIRGEGDQARAESYVLAITGPEGGPTSQTPGFYDDELVRTAGGWKIRSRRLALDVPKA